MGSSESTLSSSQRADDEITTVSRRLEGVDPLLEKLRSLKIATPILTAPPSETSLTDVLVRKPPSTSASAQKHYSLLELIYTAYAYLISAFLNQAYDLVFLDRERLYRKCLIYILPPMDEIGTVNPTVLLELFSVYHDWQEAKAQKISKKQEELENKIEVADALAVKLLQRFNYSVSTMKTTSHHLSEVHALQVELGELKGRLTEVISNCDALCRRIASEGPESLRSSIKPFSSASELEASCSLPSQERSPSPK